MLYSAEPSWVVNNAIHAITKQFRARTIQSVDITSAAMDQNRRPELLGLNLRVQLLSQRAGLEAFGEWSRFSKKE